MSYSISFLQDTVVKLLTRQSSELGAEQKHSVSRGKAFPIGSWSQDGNHIKFSLGKNKAGEQLAFQGKNTWFAFADHVQILKDGVEIAKLNLKPVAADDHMKMVPSGIKDIYTLFWMRGGKPVDRVYVCSGQAGLKPVKREEDYSGSMRPCPPGEYKLGPVEEGNWGSAIGYYWISVYGTEPRQAVGIHEDANRGYAPGSAGCICPLNENDMQAVAYWRRSGADRIIIDYGF